MATKKKAVVKKAAPKKAVSPKPVKELSGLEIARKQSLEDPRLWGTESAGIPIDHFVPLPEVKKMVRRFNKEKGPIPKKAFMQPSNIDKKAILKLLEDSSIVALRYYFGYNEHNRIQVFFVGSDANHSNVYARRKKVDKKSKTALPTKLGADTIPPDEEEGAIDMAQGCPAYGSGETVMLP